MVTKEDLKGLTSQELKDLYWLNSEAKKLTGKDLEEEIITNYLLLDKLLKTEDEEEAKQIESKLLENMRRKIEEEV